MVLFPSLIFLNGIVGPPLSACLIRALSDQSLRQGWLTSYCGVYYTEVRSACAENPSCSYCVCVNKRWYYLKFVTLWW